MNYGAFQISPWISGLALFAAVVLACRVSPACMRAAAVSWSVGVLCIYSGPVSQIIWIHIIKGAGPDSFIHLLRMAFVHILPFCFAFAGSVMLHPMVSRERAMGVAMTMVRYVGPVYASFVCVTYFVMLPSGLRWELPPFPVYGVWIFYTLLWIRIRKNLEGNDEVEAEEAF
jgi:hypothetical protein